jgi:hypothetical protein
MGRLKSDGKLAESVFATERRPIPCIAQLSRQMIDILAYCRVPIRAVPYKVGAEPATSFTARGLARTGGSSGCAARNVGKSSLCAEGR